MALAPKQQAFVDEYIIDLNATQAAIRAGYSAKTAGAAAGRLLQNVKVREAVDKAKAKRSDITGINAEWVLKRLAALVDTNLSDFMVVPDDGRLPYYDFTKATPEQMAAIETLQIDTRHDSGDSEGYTEKVKLGLPNKLRALELVGKHVNVKAFIERAEMSGPDGGPLEIREKLPPMELAKGLLGLIEQAKKDKGSKS